MIPLRIPSLLAACLILMGLAACHAERRPEVRSDQYRACLAGDLEACHAYGVERLEGKNEDRRSALVAFKYACLLDHAGSCEKLAQMYGRSPTRTDQRRAREANRAACDGGELGACVKLAKQLPDRQARPIYEHACEGGQAEGCVGLARILRKGWRLTENLQRALALDEKACELGSMEGCRAAGQAYLFGSGVEPDPRKGLAFLEKTCDEEVSEGCEMLARVYKEGMGVEADPEKAARYAELASAHSDDDVADSPEAAFLVFVNACNFDDLLGCFNAGSLLAEGRDVERNITTSREFFERACDGGLQTACTRWKEIESTHPIRASNPR